MIPYATEIRAWTLANKRARDEYHRHPLAYIEGHTKRCADQGCPLGQRQFRRKR